MNLDMSRRKRAQGWMVPPKASAVLNSPNTVPTERNSYTVSARELKIPGKAQHEFEKGLGAWQADVAGSLSHFTKATEAFPDYYEAYYQWALRRRGWDRRMSHAGFQKAIDASGGRTPWQIWHRLSRLSGGKTRGGGNHYPQGVGGGP